MISNSYRCIYIHIPKTAGTSIEKKLGNFEALHRRAQDHSPIKDIEPISPAELLAIKGVHDVLLLAKRLKAKFRRNLFVPRWKFESYFKFAFVRNPWSRVFSWYKNVMADDVHKTRLGISEDCSFNTFLNNHSNLWVLNSQLFWITDTKGEIPLDFIGRFEKLEEDFSHVCDVLQIKDKALPRLLMSKNKHYSEFYDEETIELVARKYRAEIEYFNYEFGD